MNNSAIALRAARRVANTHLEHEAVELRLGKRIRAFVLDRVLRCEYQERLAEVEGLPADRDLLLLHRLEQRRLHFPRRALDFVGEHEVGKDRTLLGIELLRSLV